MLRPSCPNDPRLPTPVVALRFHTAESFPEADGGNVSDDPDVWLVAVASTLKKPT
jgi:hypothetical protein